MRRRTVWAASGAAIVAAIGGLAAAQVSYPTPIDVASKTDIGNAITAATPAPCPTPQPDTLTGSAGTGTPCMARPDATRPTQVQPATAVTANDGTWSVTWTSPFTNGAPTTVFATLLDSSSPYICQVGAKSATGASGKCYQVIASTLPSTSVALLGYVVSTYKSPTAGMPVMVVGRQ